MVSARSTGARGRRRRCVRAAVVAAWAAGPAVRPWARWCRRAASPRITTLAPSSDDRDRGERRGPASGAVRHGRRLRRPGAAGRGAPRRAGGRGRGAAAQRRDGGPVAGRRRAAGVAWLAGRAGWAGRVALAAGRGRPAAGPRACGRRRGGGGAGGGVAGADPAVAGAAGAAAGPGGG